MRNKPRKRNTPIATLIRNYTNKKSGKVSESREEIKWRFNALDWKDQKKILLAFLNSCMSDREWAYGKMLNYWDDSFIPKVKELWETYDEYKCSWSVIRYFPLDYIKEHISDFTDERDYFFICLRLAKDENFVIDRSKLSNTDYLALLYHTGRDITCEDACDTLFSIVHACCLKETYLIDLDRLYKCKYRNVISPANFREVNLAFYYILKLQQYEAAGQFRNWNNAVEETIHNSPEFNAIDRNNFSLDFDYDQRRIKVARIYAFQALDDKYKKDSDPSMEEMRDAYEKNIEWPRLNNNLLNGTMEYSILDILEAGVDGSDDIPF